MPDMTESRTPMAISTRNAPSFIWREVCEGWTLVSVPALHVIQERMPPRTYELPHLHEATHQFYFVLKGEATVVLAGDDVLVDAGEGIEILPGLAHQMRNDSDGMLEFIVASSRPPREDRIDLP